MKQFIKINPADNVFVALVPLTKGTTLNVEGDEVTLITDVPAGHKCALKDFAEGENIIKYGFPIGHARHAIKRGSFLNHEDIKTNLRRKGGAPLFIQLHFIPAYQNGEL